MGADTKIILLGSHDAYELAMILKTDKIVTGFDIHKTGSRDHEVMLAHTKNEKRHNIHVFHGNFSDNEDVYSGERTYVTMSATLENRAIAWHLASAVGGFVLDNDSFEGMQWDFVAPKNPDVERHPAVRLAVELAAFATPREAEVLRAIFNNPDRLAKLEDILARYRSATETPGPRI